jgi:hypothetical protein
MTPDGPPALGPDTDRNAAAVMLAVLSGWLKAGGDRPHSVAITWKGRALLKEARHSVANA